MLVQRNAALRDALPASVVQAWDPGLVETGAEVISARKRWIENVGPKFGDYYARVSNDGRARMTYESSLELGAADTSESVRDVFRAALIRASERDRRLGTTTVGPHRDEVRLSLDGGDDGLDLREYGSGGQRRTAALALRLVEAETIRERRGVAPLILVDDAFAELDEGRSERVLELMEASDTGQVVLTAPKESDVRFKRQTLARWRIKTGRVTT